MKWLCQSLYLLSPNDHGDGIAIYRFVGALYDDVRCRRLKQHKLAFVRLSGRNTNNWLTLTTSFHGEYSAHTRTQLWQLCHRRWQWRATIWWRGKRRSRQYECVLEFYPIYLDVTLYIYANTPEVLERQTLRRARNPNLFIARRSWSTLLFDSFFSFSLVLLLCLPFEHSNAFLSICRHSN